MKHLAKIFILLAFSSPALAVTPGDKIDNFQLLDHTGTMHELHYYSDMDAVVLMVQGNGCPIVRNANRDYQKLKEQYADQNVKFLMLNANLQDDRESIVAEAEEFDIDFPILMDKTQIIAESLGVERTADTFVIDPDTWEVTYRGNLDDRLGYETQRVEAREQYVADALDAMLADQPVEVAQTDAKGCLVAMPEADNREQHKEISFSDEVAPILVDKCVDCHRDGGIGPFAMNDYDVVRGFAPMIREVIRTKRMPPWHADPHVGEFENDRSLSNEEIKTLVHWIEAGAPRGDGADTLAQHDPEYPEWELGEPDLVLDIPSYDVPATGVVDYLNPQVRNPLNEDRWVRAVEINPGSREALHHVITTFGVPNDDAPRGFQPLGGLGGYVPGNPGEEFPQETGVLLPADAVLNFQMHYTTFGKEVTDRSRLGVHFYDEDPDYPLESITLMNTQIKIPANTKEHWEQKKSEPLERDIYLYTLLPHSHFRGKAANFVARYPDGSEETLLRVPDYDFNWQTTYRFDEPKRLPAGTVIVYNQAWDNSVQNPANPDPDRTVPWGQQSWDEMLFGNIKFRYVDPKPGDSSGGLAIDE